MELQKNTPPKLPQELLQNGMAVSLVKKDFEAVSALAPRTVKEAIKNGLPIVSIAKVTGMEAIYAQVEFDLIKCLAMLNLNLTIKESQYPFIVRELVDTFSSESIEDFQLCFKNGVKGKYGKIYNVDLSVLSIWMGEYLEEKYQLIESGTITDSTEALPDVDYSAFKQRKAQEWAKDTQEKESALKAEYERQKAELEFEEKRRGYKAPDEDFVIKAELKREWAREHTDLHSGKILPNSPSFEEWLNNR